MFLVVPALCAVLTLETIGIFATVGDSGLMAVQRLFKPFDGGSLEPIVRRTSLSDVPELYPSGIVVGRAAVWRVSETAS
jgi:hypothetical protein